MKKAICLTIAAFMLVGVANAFGFGPEPRAMTAAEKAYISKITIFDQEVKDTSTGKLDTEVGVNFKMRNDGNQALESIKLRLYFVDTNGEDVLVKDMWALDGAFDNNLKPFLPGQLWQVTNLPHVYFNRFPGEKSFQGDIEVEVTEVLFVENEYPGKSLLTADEKAYAANIEVSEATAKRLDSWGTPAQIRFHLKNNGKTAIRVVYLRACFYDEQGHLTQVRDFPMNLPDGLAPGAAWQFPRGEFVEIGTLPKHWHPAKIDLKVMGVNFVK